VKDPASGLNFRFANPRVLGDNLSPRNLPQEKIEPMPWDCDGLMAKLSELGIATSTVEHEPLRTVEVARRLRGDLPGGHVKNLFLKDVKRNFWLIVTLEEATVDLKATAQMLEAKKFSFASPAELDQYLGIVPGAVSPFAVINDQDRVVSLVLDERLLDFSPLNFHPLRNDRTTAITPPDFLRFLDATGHKPRLISIPN
jgi:Ala-tRNA(Pro) deacylase